MAPSGTMKASPRSVLTQGPIVPVSEVHFVFSNRNLSSTSGQCMFKYLKLPLCVYNSKLSLKESKKSLLGGLINLGILPLSFECMSIFLARNVVSF